MQLVLKEGSVQVDMQYLLKSFYHLVEKRNYKNVQPQPERIYLLWMKVTSFSRENATYISYLHCKIALFN